MSISVDLSSITDTFLDDDGFDGDDMSKVIAAPSIYGRKREQNLLLSTFQELVLHPSHPRQIVLLHGCSGTGKTALVEKFRESLCARKEAYFCSGKYFQNSSVQEPYSAIMAAFSDLCDLISQDQDFNGARKLQIRQQFGREVDVLTKLISNLSPFLGTTRNTNEVPLDDLSDECTLYKFKTACKIFLRVMSSGKRPVVIFLDDIQWMDRGSELLLEMYINDSELKNVMFILAYRDEEEEAFRGLASLRKSGFVDILIQNLNSEEVMDLLVGVLKTSATDALRGLAELVHKRTAGNVFHVLQFIEAIEREKLLVFDGLVGSWMYNVKEIQREVMASDSLVDLLLRRIHMLPQDEQEALKIASLVGYQFEATDVFEVARAVNSKQTKQAETDKISTVSLSLVNAVELGIVEKINNEKTCIFSHDKIQSCFHSMLSLSEEQELQRMIGEVFLRSSAEDSKYRAVVHLNQAVDSRRDPQFRFRLALLNLEASRYCKSRSAFDVAASLLREGLSLLEGDEMWFSNFDVAFEMTEALARMELSIGNLNECKRLTTETLHRATTRDMKVNSLLIAVDCLMAGNEMSSVIVTASSALATLGIQMPRKVSVGHVLLKYVKMRRLLRQQTDEDILQLSIVEDSAIMAAIRILVNVGFYCLLQDKKILGIYAGLCAAELTLIHGLSPYSATAMIFYGTVDLTFGLHERAYRFGRLAMKMIEKVQCRDTVGVTVSLWVTALGHWEEPLENLQHSIMDAIEAGFETGDTVYTALAIANKFGSELFLGHNLHDLEVYMRQTYDRLLDLSKEAMLLWVQPVFQTVLNLTSESSNWRDLIVLSGEVMNEGDYFHKAILANHPILMVVALTYKGNLAYDFGYTEKSVEIYTSMKDMGKEFHNNYGSLVLYLYSSLSYYEQYGRTGKRNYLKIARKWKRELERAHAKGNPNASFVALLQAQDLSTRRSTNTESVRAAYNAAITVTGRDRYTHYESLANRRAACFMADRGLHDEANAYFDRAIALLQEWGALSNAAWLEESRSKMMHNKRRSGQAEGYCGVELVGEDIVVLSQSILHN